MEVVKPEKPEDNGTILEKAPKPGTFQPGFDPRRNTNGKPPGARHFTTKVKEALLKIADGTDSTHEQLLIKRILKKAIHDGDGRMIQLLWEQIDGKAPQAIDITSGGEQITTLSLEERAKLDQILLNNK